MAETARPPRLVWAFFWTAFLLAAGTIVIGAGAFALWALWFFIAPTVAFMEGRADVALAYLAVGLIGALFAGLTIHAWSELRGEPPGYIARHTIVIGWTVASALWLSAAMPDLAHAHSYYHYGCCSDNDCRPLAWEWVKTTPEGYLVWEPGAETATLIPFGDKRIRPTPAEDTQQRFHICTEGGRAGARVICLYVPTGGA